MPSGSPGPRTPRSSRELDALLITPSIDFRYLLGYTPPPLERLTCLVVRPDQVPILVVPRLELPLAVQEMGELAGRVEAAPWDEGSDPYQAVRGLLRRGAAGGGPGPDVGAPRPAAASSARPGRAGRGGAGHLSPAAHQGADEIFRLRRAAQVADTVMLAATGTPLTGTTERELSERIRYLLVLYGHETADFAIVASGPNSASPHHEPRPNG